MDLYAIPGGDWAGTEKDYTAKMKAAGLDAKTAARKKLTVPTDKAGLMQFLIFHGVDPLGGRHMGGPGIVVTPAVDVEALRAKYNPDSDPHRVVAAAITHAENAMVPAPPPNDAGFTDAMDLASAFSAAPIKLQAELVVAFVDRLTAGN